MPQMKPMNWFYLMMYFIILLMIILTNLNYFYKLNNKTIINLNMKPMINYKFLW